MMYEEMDAGKDRFKGWAWPDEEQKSALLRRKLIMDMTLRASQSWKQMRKRVFA